MNSVSSQCPFLHVIPMILEVRLHAYERLIYAFADPDRPRAPNALVPIGAHTHYHNGSGLSFANDLPTLFGMTSIQRRFFALISLLFVAVTVLIFVVVANLLMSLVVIK